MRSTLEGRYGGSEQLGRHTHLDDLVSSAGRSRKMDCDRPNTPRRLSSTQSRISALLVPELSIEQYPAYRAYVICNALLAEISQNAWCQDRARYRNFDSHAYHA